MWQSHIKHHGHHELQNMPGKVGVCYIAGFAWVFDWILSAWDWIIEGGPSTEALFAAWVVLHG